MRKIFWAFAALSALAACKMAASGVKILSGDFDAPKLAQVSSKSEGTFEIEFSKPVKSHSVEVYRLNFDGAEPDFADGLTLQKGGDAVPFSARQTGDAKITVSLEGEGAPGEKFGIDGTVGDGRGNSLSFSAVVTGFNSRTPEKINLSELRTTKSSSKTPAQKAKFIEMKIASDGNLAGMCLLTAGNSADFSRFEFPAVEVKAGDFAVLHVLPKGTELPKNELHAKKESKEDEATDGWDFWTTDERFALSSTGICLLERSPAGELADAVLLCPAGKEKWTRQVQEDLARRAFEAQKWEGGFLPKDAFDSAKLSGGAAAVRKNFGSFRADAWERVTASKATPGK